MNYNTDGNGNGQYPAFTQQLLKAASFCSLEKEHAEAARRS